MQEKKKNKANLVPCPHCGKPVSPASLLAHMRAKKLKKEDRKAIALKAGIASKKAMLKRKKQGK